VRLTFQFLHHDAHAEKNLALKAEFERNFKRKEAREGEKKTLRALGQRGSA